MDNKDLLKEQLYDRSRADEFIGKRAKALGISRRRLVQLLAGSASIATVGLLLSLRDGKLAKAQTSQTVAQAEEIPPIVKEIRPEWFYQIKTN
ncbi:MAG: hypothetical protein F6K10_35690 [Moorea sp. SIO2B7]|nr:hypothetical protein [Moorena sp. SIO2B7]